MTRTSITRAGAAGIARFGNALITPATPAQRSRAKAATLTGKK